MHERRAIALSRANRKTNSRIVRRKYIAWSIFLSVVGLCTFSLPLFAQDSAPPLSPPKAMYTVVPLTGVSAEAVRGSVAASTTIPMWTYHITSNRDGLQYSGSMVGRSPFFHGARATKVPTFIVPLKINMPDGGVFDPTSSVDSGCSPAGTALSLIQSSPIFTPIDLHMGTVDMGVAQYVDAFQRANFWSDVSVTATSYHTSLSATTLGVQTFNVPSGKGATYNATNFVGGCGKIGVVDFSTMNNFVTGTLLPSLAGSGVGPTNFPFILLYNVVMGNPGDSLTSNCCILGFHGAFGFPTQTYSPADYDTTHLFSNSGNTSVASHEVGEWMDDPLGTNPTPLWGHIGQVSGCQNNLEDGDPLSGTLFPSVLMPNGVTYALQELAFFSWFYASPSLAVNGWFSDNGKFTNDAGAVCM